MRILIRVNFHIIDKDEFLKRGLDKGFDKDHIILAYNKVKYMPNYWNDLKYNNTNYVLEYDEDLAEEDSENGDWISKRIQLSKENRDEFIKISKDDKYDHEATYYEFESKNPDGFTERELVLLIIDAYNDHGVDDGNVNPYKFVYDTDTEFLYSYENT